jgi:hypothetical protein
MTQVRTSTTEARKLPHAAGAGRGNGELPPVDTSFPQPGWHQEARRVRTRLNRLLQTIDRQARFEFLTGGMYVFEQDEESLEDWPQLSGLLDEHSGEEQQEESDTSLFPLVARSGNPAFSFVLYQAQEGA